MQDVAQRTAFLIDREGRGAGGVELRERRRCRTSTSCWPPPGPCSACCGLYAVAAVVATEPAIAHVATQFMAGGAPGHGEAAPGDHLQTDYRLWLAGHQLEHGRAPWSDPYSFRPEAGRRSTPAWWPFGLPFWPLGRLLGLVVAWNLFTLLCLFAAGLLAMLWLRELGAVAARCAAGGLAFEIAPYRLSRAAATCSGRSRSCSPLALWAFERARAAELALVVRSPRWRSPRSPCRARCTSRSGRSPSMSSTRSAGRPRGAAARGNRRRRDRGRPRGRARPADRRSTGRSTRAGGRSPR